MLFCFIIMEHRGFTRGGADYFANQALLALKKIDQKTYDKRVEKALNSCLAQVGKYSISDADSHDDMGMVYDCGSFVHYTVDNILGDGSVSKLWKKLFTNLHGSSSYSEKDWFKALNEIGHDKKAVSDIIELISHPFTGQDFIHKTELLGWNFYKKQLSNEDNSFRLSFNMFKDLMNDDCSGIYAFNTNNDMINITNNESCQQFKLGSISRIDDVKVGTYSLYKIYNDIKSKCKNGGELKMTSGRNSSYLFKCHTELRNLSPRLEVYVEK